ncbi:MULTISPECIES: hypothetical protein [unclassified Azospirillum]|uniref:hypothetical protein n=1 Tax=unclassified Azospirillum TaxID=2630922 RepID=UPI001FCCF69F|nr:MULTISPECIES: hypothetical protein [unclassified Azospirillum]
MAPAPQKREAVEAVGAAVEGEEVAAGEVVEGAAAGEAAAPPAPPGVRRCLRK